MKNTPTYLQRQLPLWGICLLFFLSGCKLSDLRTSEMQAAMDADGAEAKGRAFLENLHQKHGGAQWDQLDTYQVTFKEEFKKLKFVAPFPKGKATVQMAFVANNYDGRLTFTEGKKKGEEWGLVDWDSWYQKPEGLIEWKHSKKIKFWIPTYQYFIQMPQKIREATFVRYAGSKTLAGVPCEVVFASWNSDEPQKDMDQYLIYINRETGFLHAATYTVRGVAKWVVGTCLYETYLDVEGIRIPGQMKVGSLKENSDKQKVLHVMEVLDFHPNKIPAAQISLEQ